MEKQDRLSREAHFIAGSMARRVPLIVAEMGADVDPFMLHIDPAPAEKERKMMAERTRAALAPLGGRGKLGSRTSLPDGQAKGSAPTADAARRFAENVAPVICDTIASGGN